MVVLPQEDCLMPRLSSVHAFALAAVFFLLVGCAKPTPEVVVYTSQDQVYAEPILQEFTQLTGIKVRPVFDTESVKTAGLANRLRFEKTNPQCDLFWNNEEMHTRFLAREGVLDAASVKAAGYRTRRVVINSKLLKPQDAPKSLLELTNAHWRGKVVLAYPLFGTTAYHFLALRQHWGENQFQAWCRALVANEAKVVDGNSVVVKLVGSGEALIGLTDSDDIAAGKRQDLPVVELPLNRESLAIPNTLALTVNAPRAEHARALADFITSPATLQKLVQENALEGADLDKVRAFSLQMDWNSPLASFDEAAAFLKTVFLR